MQLQDHLFEAQLPGIVESCHGWVVVHVLGQRQILTHQSISLDEPAIFHRFSGFSMFIAAGVKNWIAGGLCRPPVHAKTLSSFDIVESTTSGKWIKIDN